MFILFTLAALTGGGGRNSDCKSDFCIALLYHIQEENLIQSSQCPSHVPVPFS